MAHKDLDEQKAAALTVCSGRYKIFSDSLLGISRKTARFIGQGEMSEPLLKNEDLREDFSFTAFGALTYSEGRKTIAFSIKGRAGHA